MAQTEPLRRRDDGTHWADLEPGEFSYLKCDISGRIKWINFWPDGLETPLSVPIHPQRSQNGHSWALSGHLDFPTLDPSVNVKDYWHGWVREGKVDLV